MRKIAVVLILLLLFAVGCNQTENQEDPASESETTAVEEETTEPDSEDASLADTKEDSEEATEDTDTTQAPVRIAGMKGATSMGMAMLLDQAEKGEAGQAYETAVYTAADDIMPRLLQGELDIAALPVNAASILWNKSSGGIQVIAVNTLGVLEVLEKGDQIASLADLEGQTVYMTGQGTVPEYSLRALMEQAGVSFDNVQIEWKSEPTEITTLLATEDEAICVLPQPFATVALQKVEGLEKKLDFTDLWDETMDAGQFVTGVFVARTEFVESQEETVRLFLSDYQKSVEEVKASPAPAAEVIGELGIVDAALAEKAIPAMHLVSLQGEEMQQAVEGFLGALHETNPESVGGNLPDETFYFK